jgi:GTPase
LSDIISRQLVPNQYLVRMLIDDVTIQVAAGNGGKGAVAFNKNKMSLGPTGGSGGKGGNVYFEGVSDLSALKQFRYKKEAQAKNGADGRTQYSDGENGADLVLRVPVGTVVHKEGFTSETEITKIGERVLIATGGIGGRGNFHFRSSRNTSPKQFQGGRPGEAFTARLELKMIADVGLVGLPNAGKSSLLNELTRAKSRVANYPFTTLEPHLGTYYELILADIPGIIEGASGGKGLGTKFLRHIERTKIIFHLVAADSETLTKDYRVIRKELVGYSPALGKKPEYVFLSKSDLINASELKKKLATLKKINKNAVAISVIDSTSLEKVKKILNKIQATK